MSPARILCEGVRGILGMQMAVMKFDEVLRTFAGYFERERIRYAVAGGLALQAWGGSRATYDVDFVAEGQRRGDIVGFAGSLGYQTLYASEGYSNHRHPDERLGSVDFVYVYNATADALFSSAVAREVVGVSLPVTQPELLIAMKVRAMQNAPRRVLIDAPDIAFLMRLPAVDRSRVRDYFSRHGLLKVYDELEKESSGLG